MNTQGKVNKRLFSKTDLATHKVELNAIKEVQNFGNSLNKLTESIKDLSEQEQKIFDEKQKQIQNGKTISQKLKQELDNIFKKADELGVRKEIFNQTKIAREAFENFKKVAK